MIRAIACLFLFSTLCFTRVVAADGSSNTAANGHSTPQSAGLLLTAEALASVVAHGPWPPALKPDPSNRVSGNPVAIALGQQLFFSPLLSGAHDTSCAACHAPDQAFASGPAITAGTHKLDRNTQTLLNVRFHRWFGWDGRNDNLWAQSIRPIGRDIEMNLPLEHVRSVATNPAFADSYSTLFGDAKAQNDELILVNIGKALAAFQETLVTEKTTFDHFRDAVAKQDWKTAANYPASAQRGLSLFVGRGRCHFCHSGALFSNGEFHDAAVPYFVRPGVVDSGRHQGIIDLKQSPFTLDGNYTDDPEKSGAWAVRNVAHLHANFGVFRVPSLRNVANTAPYMHNGSLATLEAVVDHYSNIDMDRLHVDGEAILMPLGLNEQEVKDLVAFLKTL